ncbi:MAG: sortase [bacterium]
MDYFKPHKYIKMLPAQNSYAKLLANENNKKQKLKVLKVSIATIFISLGFAITSTKVIKPYAKSLALATTEKPLFSPVLGYKTGLENFSFEELKNYQKPLPSFNKNVPEKFFLTIPKLGIYEADVKTNDLSLKPDSNLGHYANTALPGESGNSFIYGHATFEEYFNPKDYKTIFSTLPKISAGDEFYIKYLGNTYKYIVTMKKTLDPSDVNPYEIFYPNIPNNSTISLMTCTPPGRKDYRLLVIGSLVK